MDANEIIAAITERVKDTANVQVVFGETVETAAGVSIIPVASVKVSGAAEAVRATGAGRRKPAKAKDAAWDLVSTSWHGRSATSN